MRVLELYSGIGGMHYALKESGISAVVVAAADINTVANEVYEYNFPRVNNINRNIESLTAKEIKSMNIDSIFMSPPCQPFTRVGLQKDSKDNRSLSLFHIFDIIPEIETLKHVLVENVKGFENSETRLALVDCLEKCDFNWKEMILSPCQFGVPNTRKRYYLLAKRKNLKFCFTNFTLALELSDDLMKILPEDRHLRLAKEDNNNDDDVSSSMCYRLERIIDENIDAEEYSLPEKLLLKRATVLDVRTSESRGSCCFTKAYGRYVEGTGSIYSPMSQKIVNEKFQEFEKIRERHEDFTKTLSDLRLRFFTPSEVSKLMCFPESFKFPNSTTRKQKYRLLGNSINIHVVSRLIYLLNHEG